MINQILAGLSANAQVLADTQILADDQILAGLSANAQVLADTQVLADAQVLADTQVLADAQVLADTQVRAGLSADAQVLADDQVSAGAQTLTDTQALTDTQVSAGLSDETQILADDQIRAGLSADIKKRVELEIKVKETWYLEAEAQAALNAAQDQQIRSREAIRQISKSYHPYDLETGQARNATVVEESLKKQFKELLEMAAEAQLSDSSIKRIQKAKRVMIQMVATIAFSPKGTRSAVLLNDSL